MSRSSDKVREAKPVRLWFEPYRFFGLFSGNSDWRLCLGRLRLRFPRTNNLEWDDPFNALSSVDWQFSLENARTKLKRLYPSTS